jgi:protein-S-isoprenylcysteine O-methyltransferase Ste14
MLLVRALFFVIVLPGTIGVLIPSLILRETGESTALSMSVGNVGAGLLMTVGTSLLLWSVWQFFAEGRGTLAPVDPPKVVVVHGPYRFTRNPMYNGVVALILGTSWMFRSEALLYYALAVLCTFHLFVVFYEEPALSAQFGSSYEQYRQGVPRWGVTWRPYRANGD